MLAAPSIVQSLSDGNFSDSGSVSGLDSSAHPKFPHTRAQLTAIAREYKPVDSSGTDSDAEGEYVGRVSSALVKLVAGLLDEENEEGLKALLKENFGIDNNAVSTDCSRYLFHDTKVRNAG